MPRPEASPRAFPLPPEGQVALTLRTVCGLTTADIARAFLDTEPTMGQRLSRAKAKIAKAKIAKAKAAAQAAIEEKRKAKKK